MDAEVSTYLLKAHNGRPIRTATQVRIGGKTIQFMERVGKKRAIEQAQNLLERFGDQIQDWDPAND